MTKSNIWKFNLFSFLFRFIMYLPFIVYYFQELEFSLTMIAMLGSAMSITLFIFEIPSGYIADRFGRKNSIIVAVIFQLASMFILYSATSFFMIVVSHVVWGLAAAFFSGADSAFLYDSLLVMKKEELYKKVHGKAKFYAEMAVIFSAVTGSLIIKFGIKHTIAFTIVGHLASLLVAFSFHEPYRHRPIEKMPLKKELSQLMDIVSRSLRHGKLLGLFIYSFIVMGVSNTIFFMYQPYFRATSLPLYYYGYVFAAFSIFTAFASLKAHDIEKRIGIFSSLLLMPLFMVFSLLGASLSFVWFGFMFFFFREVVRGFSYPILNDYTNKVTESSERATVLSIRSMFSRMGLTVILLVFGLFSDAHGLRIVFLAMGLILLGFTITIPFIIRHRINGSYSK